MKEVACAANRGPATPKKAGQTSYESIPELRPAGKCRIYAIDSGLKRRIMGREGSVR